MLTRRFPLAALVAFAVVVGIAVGLRLIAWNEEGARNEVGIGGPFALHDGDGRVVTDQDFRGRYMLVYFGYTYCPDICPATLSILSSALDKLPPDERAQVAPIFITVDPDRDTPAVVKTYVAAFHPSIIGLSGSESEIAAVEKIYRVYAARVPNDDLAVSKPTT